MNEAPGARRRCLLAGCAACATMLGGAARPLLAQGTDAAERRWYDAALAMKRLAESWGDQAYGAVLVLQGRIVGEGPSRVVQRGDPEGHAEREAIRDAQLGLGRMRLDGSVLVSTSRPCSACERAAAMAGVSRMVYGAALHDAGAPRL